jgi:hypothetical protein
MMFKTFDEVVKRYEDTKPIRGGRASQDLRPLGQRRYWWNRVAKVSDTKYLLLDGNWSFMYHHNINTDGILEQTAPIVWERKEDGDYITIRNHSEGGCSISRYTFLATYLPSGMRFDWCGNGKHFVKYQGHDYYLPKFKAKMDWQNKTFTMIEDHNLTFKVNGTGFTRVSKPLPMQTRKVDKDIDAYYKLKIKELWDWMQIVLPVMGDTLGDSKQTYAESLGSSGYWYWVRQMDKTLIREILDNPEHDKRMALAGLSAYDIGAINNGRFEPTKESWSKFRSLMRKIGGMYAVELV